jgi:hypothetical protein
LAREHVLPQLPQFVSEVSAVSHPLLSTPSQLPQFVLHDPIAHDPVAQVAVAFDREHVAPQLPQFVSEVSAVSHPLPSTPSQLPQFGLHEAIAHDPVAQVALAFGRAQAVPQLPQLVVVLSVASQPLASFPSQLPKPLLHDAIAHDPVAQVALAFARAHAVPHAPQSVRVLSWVSQPLAGFPSQSPHPPVHPGWHCPLTQATPPCWFEQTWPQLPQLLVSVSRGTSQPSESEPLQFA